MKRLTRWAMEGRVRRAVVGAFLLVGLGLLTQAIPRKSVADPSPGLNANIGSSTASAVAGALAEGALGAAAVGDWADPQRTMGAKACIHCHRSEYLAWLSTKHYNTEATIANFSGNTEKYAKALGIKQADVMHNSLCANCHVTPQASEEGKLRSISGVSCESCHGGSGGEEGWLNRHAVYGPNVTRIDQETAEHRQSRTDYCEKAGMVRAANAYAIARNCLVCHSVVSEKLVNAGHKVGAEFELVGWSIGNARHNFHMEQSVNAEGPSLWAHATGGETAARKRVKFIVGVLANIEVSLNALGTVTDGEGDFAGAHVERAGGALEILGGIIDAMEDDAPEELGEAMEAVEGAEIEDADFSEKESRDNAAAAARTIAAIAMKIAAGDGSKLAGVDEFMNEEVVEVKGEPYTRE